MTTTLEIGPVEKTACRWCGYFHGLRCPIVKAMEFDPTGMIVTRVEFVTDADRPPEQPPWPYARR